MQKSRLGISVGLLGAAIYLVALFGGYIPLILLAGYVLLFEENPWLRRSAVKAGVIVFVFSLLSALIGFIPNAMELISDIVRIFNGSFYIPVVSNIISLTNTVLMIVQKILLLVLGIKALTQGNLPIGSVDNTVSKHIG